MSIRMLWLFLGNFLLVQSVVASQMYEPSSKAYAIASLAQAMRSELSRMERVNECINQMDAILIDVNESFSALGAALSTRQHREEVEMLYMNALYAFDQLTQHEDIINQSMALGSIFGDLSGVVARLDVG